VKRDQVDIIQVLLDHGTDTNVQDNDGCTPLHCLSWRENSLLETATGRGAVEGVRLLLKHGAMIDAEDNKGRTPLQLALEYKRHDIATCLTENGST
jgi:ankyrin repeat protein